MDQLGDRRRLREALNRLTKGQGFPLPAASQPGALSWDIDRVGAWLQDEGFPGLVASFSSERIDGCCLLLLDREDLATLGVQKLGQRSKLLKKLRALKEETDCRQQPAVSEGSCESLEAPDGNIVHPDALQQIVAMQHRIALLEERLGAQDAPSHLLSNTEGAGGSSDDDASWVQE
mmetsp:Transcript_39256/g.85767  ORF Transcript_39256/g.85767 Transcript_39256/m.85767 type:complete len:176 (-) Transcript_39256:14-541(-)